VALTSELDMGPEILEGSVRFIPLRDKSAQPQSVSVATSAGRSPPRIARVVADLLAEHVQAYMARVRASGGPAPRRKPGVPVRARAARVV
jgi:hypothetical protein